MSNVSIEEVSPMSCRVKWQPPDDDGGLPLLGYFVETSEDHENWTRVNKDVSTEEELILNHLVENREYSARVIAQNIVGSSTLSMAPTTFVPKFQRPFQIHRQIWIYNRMEKIPSFCLGPHPKETEDLLS